MSPIRSVVPEDWRVPLLAGAASLPFTLASYQQSGSTMSLSAVLFAGLVVGFWTGADDRVGARTGLVGGLAVLRLVAEAVALLPVLSGPSWVIVCVMGTVFVTLVFGFSAFLGEVGAHVGEWIARRSGRQEATTGA